jgi:GNAT superfamily N-acetyltransferase
VDPALISSRDRRRNFMPESKPPLWKIALAKTPEQIGQCSSVMRELRPHIKAIDFAARVLQQQQEGYQLAYLELDRVVRSVAGFRIFNLLFSGRTLYIDDLVTHDSDRSRGFGAALFDWLVEHAKANGCEFLTLDSGVQRFAAHRFYLKHGMDITAHHFQLKLDS